MFAPLLIPALVFSSFAPSLPQEDPPPQAQQSPRPVTQGALMAPAAAIQDNSFLLEEAYNQEPGVIQHISAFQRNPSTGDWFYTFTEEWPVPGQKHQFSVTVPFERIQASPDHASAFGDVFLNYRRQLVGSGDSRVAVAPRFSLILPVGDAHQLRGGGALGYQFNLPASVTLGSFLVAHSNAGVTLIPGSHNGRGDRADAISWNLGQSLIWLVAPKFNAVFEVAYARLETVVAANRTAAMESWLLNPGIRWAIDCKNGLQVVPGVSMPMGVGPSRGQRSLFLYLSLEHPLWKAQ
jgi:hypothetical protein